MEKNIHIYVFGFGSLMNEESLRATLPGKKIFSWATLQGYKRAFNKAGRTHRYLNIKPNRNSSIRGVLIRVTLKEFEELKRREYGYTPTDITDSIDLQLPVHAIVYTFVAPDFRDLKISRKYLNTVLDALPLKEQKKWLKETDFEGAEIDEEN